jgi:hypothetical protein
MGFADKGFCLAAWTKKGKSTMGTLYFLLPIVGTVALISFIIARINERSYLHRRVEARYASNRESDSGKDLCPREKLEQRYVDWFTREEEGRARRQADKENEEDFLVGTAYMAGGVSYRPETTNRRMAG